MTFNQVLISTLQVLLSLILGFAIGFERKIRSKEAGIRTHTIVCVGACLFMIVSRNIIGGDPSRIAAQIVSGIGFIGAGMIFYNKQAVHGLTTAAGIWATAAIGMAVGAGLWAISIIASLVIILVQYVMHLPFQIFQVRHQYKINVQFECVDGKEKDKVLKLFSAKAFSSIKATRKEDKLQYIAVINLDKEFSADKIYEVLHENDFIISISLVDDEI